MSDNISEKDSVVKTPLPLAIVLPASEKPITVVPPAVISNPASPAAPPEPPVPHHQPQTLENQMN